MRFRTEIQTGGPSRLTTTIWTTTGQLTVYGDQPTRRDQLTAIRDALDAHLDAEANAMMEQRRGEMRA